MADNRPLCRWHENRIRPLGDGHCLHPVLLHLHRTNPVEANCHGCPCHEPQPEVVKESLTTRHDTTAPAPGQEGGGK